MQFLNRTCSFQITAINKSTDTTVTCEYTLLKEKVNPNQAKVLSEMRKITTFICVTYNSCD